MKHTLLGITLALSSFSVLANFNYNDDNWISNNGHTYHEGTVVESLNNYYKDSNKMYDKFNSALAGSMAVSSIPIDYSKSFSVGVGVGGYKNGTALGISAGGGPLDAPIKFKVSASFDNSSNSSVGAGLSYGW